MLLRQERHRRAAEPRQVLHEVVDGCELARGRVTQHRVQPPLGFAREYGDTHVPAGVEIDRVAIQHRQAPRHVEAADGDGYPGFPKQSRDVEGAGILIGLNADERNKPETAVTPKAGQERRHVDACVRLVDRFDIDGDVWPENPPLGAIGRDAVHGGERIRRAHRAPPTDDVSILVVM